MFTKVTLTLLSSKKNRAQKKKKSGGGGFTNAMSTLCQFRDSRKCSRFYVKPSSIIRLSFWNSLRSGRRRSTKHIAQRKRREVMLRPDLRGFQKESRMILEGFIMFHIELWRYPKILKLTYSNFIDRSLNMPCNYNPWTFLSDGICPSLESFICTLSSRYEHETCKFCKWVLLWSMRIHPPSWEVHSKIPF